ncbi:MAG: PepSY domain-containing protein [Phenylobacterium sp.]|uniref:PepSY-associated TM helix domain-containing protein n=1 Tax=Phenylobacterium sp. TaxID=1871053 RepID=UPI0025E1F684|nr:PepSY domain-containing protein [Phenylobacterium sp.]MCG9916278.1 PepSY domain-containing protein [Phenylobacterium sp.]
MTRSHDIRGYGAVWRLHFIAGLLVLPFLMLMAATGGAYLFREEIDAAVYGDVLKAPPSETITPSAWLSAAETATGGEATRVTVPQAGRSAEVILRLPSGDQTRLHLDPGSGTVLGQTPPDGSMDWVKDLHSLTLLGPQANLLAELAAGWAIVLVVTGAVLWWPSRSRQSPAGQRGLLRRLHGWTGSFAGLVILFLALTGMPWSALWGKTVREWTNAAGWGRPAAPAAAGAWGGGPKAAGHGDHGGPALPWTLQTTTLDHGGQAHILDRAQVLDRVAATASEAGLPKPFSIALSKDPDLAWSASHMGRQAEDMRTLYIAPDGQVSADIAYGDFGPAAQVIEWGVATHQGRQYGEFNRWLMLAGCVAIWVLALSGLAMWWLRRPRGRLGIPPRTTSPRRHLVLVLVVTPFALIFPLVGGSLMFAVAVDFAFQRLAPRLAVQTGAQP